MPRPVPAPGQLQPEPQGVVRGHWFHPARADAPPWVAEARLQPRAALDWRAGRGGPCPVKDVLPREAEDGGAVQEPRAALHPPQRWPGVRLAVGPEGEEDTPSPNTDTGPPEQSPFKGARMADAVSDLFLGENCLTDSGDTAGLKL